VGKRTSSEPQIVNADKVAEVVAMMTGVPVQRIARQKEHGC